MIPRNYLVFALGMAAAVLAVAASLLIAHSIRKQLGGEPGHAAAIEARVANGDLSQAIELRAGDETSLMHAMKKSRMFQPLRR